MPTLFPPEYPDRPDAPLLAFGQSFSEEIARSVIQAVWHEDLGQPHETEIRVAAALTMLEAFHPRDHLECMLAAQGVAGHTAIMECFRRAMHADTPEDQAIKLRGNVAQLSRTFSVLLRDLERRQSKPLPERPKGFPPVPVPTSGPPPGNQPFDDFSPEKPPAGNPAPDAFAPRGAPSAGEWAMDNLTQDNAPEFGDEPELPDDIVTRADGTPGTLAAYAPKPPKDAFIPDDLPINIALATRPKPWRMVNAPPDDPAGQPSEDPMPNRTPGESVRIGARGPLNLTERIFAGDALSRFASARLDPNAPVEPIRFDEEDSIVELEFISTGGDPEAEAERAAMIAAHPEGKPVVTFRYGTVKPPTEPGDDE
jgi:hypothetical protein